MKRGQIIIILSVNIGVSTERTSIKIGYSDVDDSSYLPELITRASITAIDRPRESRLFQSIKPSSPEETHLFESIHSAAWEELIQINKFDSEADHKPALFSQYFRTNSNFKIRELIPSECIYLLRFRSQKESDLIEKCESEFKEFHSHNETIWDDYKWVSNERSSGGKAPSICPPYNYPST